MKQYEALQSRWLVTSSHIHACVQSGHYNLHLLTITVFCLTVQNSNGKQSISRKRIFFCLISNQIFQPMHFYFIFMFLKEEIIVEDGGPL